MDNFLLSIALLLASPLRAEEKTPLSADIGFSPASMIRPVPNTAEYRGVDTGTPQRLRNDPEWMQLDKEIKAGNWRAQELQRIWNATNTRRDISLEERAAMLRKIEKEREKAQSEQGRAVRRANEINDAQMRVLPPGAEPEPDVDRDDFDEFMMFEQQDVGREEMGGEVGDIREEQPESSHAGDSGDW